MNTARKHFGVAVLNNEIYVVGGADDNTELKKAEKYNPVKNSWEEIAPMTMERLEDILANKTCLIDRINHFIEEN